MPSEVENIIEEQQKSNTQLELLNQGQETFESILLELEIQTEENNKFFRGVEQSVKALGNVFLKLPSAIKENLDLSVEAQAPVVDPGIARQRDLLADFVGATKDRQSEIASLVSQNKEIAGQNETAQKAFESSIKFGLAGLAEKIPLLGNKISSGLKEGIRPETVPELEVPDQLTPDEFFATLEDGQDQALFRLINIDRGIDSLVKLNADAQSVIGSASDTESGDSKKPDEDEGFSLSNLLGFGKKGGKGGKGILGKLGKAAKIAGAVVATGLFLSDLFEGFTNDKTILDITGKAKEDLTDAEQSAASLANGISGLSFGLLDATSVFETITPAVALMQKGVDKLFDPDEGIFGEGVRAIFNAVDKFSDGDITGGLKALFDGAIESFTSIPTRLFGLIKDGVALILELLPNAVQKSINKKIQQVKDIGSGAVDFLKGLNPFADDPDETKPTTAQKNKVISVNSTKVNTEPTGLSAALKLPIIGNNIANPVSPVQVQTRAEQTNKESKKRFEERRTSQEAKNPQPIVIQQTQSEKRAIVRESANPDLRLALLNNGALDG